MSHAKQPFRDDTGEAVYLRPSADSSFAVLVHSDQAVAIAKSEKEAAKYRQTRYVVKVEDGYISVNHSGYFVLFGDLPGSDVVYRAEP